MVAEDLAELGFTRSKSHRALHLLASVCGNYYLHVQETVDNVIYSYALIGGDIVQDWAYLLGKDTDFDIVAENLAEKGYPPAMVYMRRKLIDEILDEI